MKQETLETPLQLAIAENAATPTAKLGARIWSTTALKILTWNGSAWVAEGSGGGTIGTFTVATAGQGTNAGKAPALNANGKIDSELFGNYWNAMMTEGPPVGQENESRLSMLQLVHPHPAWVGPANRRVYGPSHFSRRCRFWQSAPGQTTGWSEDLSFSVAGVATARAINVSKTASSLAQPRTGYVTTTAANATAGMQGGGSAWYPNYDIQYLGGLFLHTRVSFPVSLTGCRLFIGWLNSAAPANVCTPEPSSVAQQLAAFILDSTDASVRVVSRNLVSAISSEATGILREDLTSNLAEPQVWEFAVGTPLGGSMRPAFMYRRLGAGIPAPRWVKAPTVPLTALNEAPFMYPIIQVGNAAQARAVAVDIHHWYTESDI